MAAVAQNLAIFKNERTDAVPFHMEYGSAYTSLLYGTNKALALLVPGSETQACKMLKNST